MTAAEALTRAGLDSPGLRSRIEPATPEDVRIRRAPWVMRRLWGRGISAMTLGRSVYVDPVVLAGEPGRLGTLMVHELVHCRQWAEMGVVRFLAGYLGGYLRGRLSGKGHRQAYLDIELESEARELTRELLGLP